MNPARRKNVEAHPEAGQHRRRKSDRARAGHENQGARGGRARRRRPRQGCAARGRGEHVPLRRGARKSVGLGRNGRLEPRPSQTRQGQSQFLHYPRRDGAGKIPAADGRRADQKRKGRDPRRGGGERRNGRRRRGSLRFGNPGGGADGGRRGLSRKMTHAAFFPLVVVCSLAASGAVRAQPADVAGLALYEGADRGQRLVKGARAEREINLYSSLVLEDLNALAAAFDKQYGVKLKFWRAGSEKVVQRIVTEARAGRFDFDVVETNGPELESLHREKLLQKAGSPHFPDLLSDAIRSHREWVGTRLNMFVHAYNTNLVKKAELPKSYEDFLDPKWKGRLGIEAEDVDWFAMVVKEIGEDKGLKLFRDIVARNGLSVRRGHTLLAGLVASGEVPFALTVYNHNAEKLKQRGAPVDWYAIQPAIARVNGVALSRKPPHPHAAVLFYDFILGEGQAVLVRGNYVPTNRKADPGAARTRLKFVDPAVMLDESAKWEKLYAEIITRQSK